MLTGSAESTGDLSLSEPRVAVLGPARLDGRALSDGQRALIAALAFHRVHGAHPDELVDAVWGDDAPASARASLQNQISRLRRAHGDDLVVTGRSGYHLTVETDVEVFERSTAAARSRPPTAANVPLLVAALRRWRGVPFVDLDDGHPGVAGARARLTAVHADTVDHLAACRIAAGDPGRAAGDLLAAVEDDPFRERRWALLMTALHQDGRRIDALATFRRCALRLERDLGARPSRALLELHAAIEAEAAVGVTEPPQPTERTAAMTTSSEMAAVPPSTSTVASPSRRPR